jgi:sugar lactone lactonase YvrE
LKTAARLIATLACAGATLALPLAAGATGTDLLSTYAGTGTSGYSGDSGPATEAELASPHSVAPAPGGGYLIADADNNRIRKVDRNGLITTVAGTDTAGFNGDALPATMAELNHPSGVARTADGGFLIADTYNNRIRKVLPGLGLITTVAGTGTAGDGADGVAATISDLNSPTAVAATADGGFLIADNGNNKIRKVSPLGFVTTVAGDGSSGFGGDGGDATAAQLSCPNDVAVTADGGFLIADSGNHRIREVAADGTISTVAGDGTAGNGGDWDDATVAQLDNPNGVDVAADGSFLIADTGNDTVRRVENGTINPAADLRVAGRDAGAETYSSFNAPLDALDVAGAILVADTGGNRIRLIGNLPVGDVPVDVPFHPEPPVSDDEPENVLPEPDQPTVGEDLNVARIEGTIRVKLPGAGWVRLDRDASIPFGSIVDAASGTVTLTTARNRSGETQRAAFKGSLFRVTQKRAARPVTDLQLRGGSFDGCRRVSARKAGVASAAAVRRRARRHLWGSGHGRFRTIGRHGAATVRGTIWMTADRCDGTLVRVRRGRVEVRDFRARKTVFVRAGHSYLARKHPRRARRR